MGVGGWGWGGWGGMSVLVHVCVCLHVHALTHLGLSATLVNGKFDKASGKPFLSPSPPSSFILPFLLIQPRLSLSIFLNQRLFSRQKRLF